MKSNPVPTRSLCSRCGLLAVSAAAALTLSLAPLTSAVHAEDAAAPAAQPAVADRYVVAVSGMT